MPKAIYKLGWANRNPDHVDYPTRTRQLLANIQAGESDPIPLYMQLIDLFVDTEDWSQVVRHGNKQLALVDKAKHVAGKYHVLKALAQASRTVGSLGAAIAFSTRYVSLAKAQGNAEELVDAYLELGLAEIAQGESSDGLPQDFRSAQTSFRNALDAIKQSTTISSKDAKRIQGEITMNVGICLKSLGQIDEAMRYFTRALEVFQGLKLLAYQANAYCNIAICFDAKHDAKRALESGLVELALRRQERDSTGELQAIIDNGHRLSALGRYADAFENYELAQKLAAELEDDESEDSAKRFASTAKEHLKALEEIVRLKASLGSARGNSAQFSILANLVKSYLFLGRGLNARLDLNEQIRLAKAMNLPSSETALLSLNLGLAYELEGNFADAVLALVDGLKNMSATSNYATQVEWKQALLRVLISNEAVIIEANLVIQPNREIDIRNNPHL